MRMNTNSELTAIEVLNEYSEVELANLFYNYGEIRKSRKLAERIIILRQEKKIKTTSDLIEVLDKMAPDKRKNQFFSQVFQSIRIEVNDEIESLKVMLEDGVDLLNPGGRFTVISYHSLEDRIVKNMFKRGNVIGEFQKDFFGNIIKEVKEINKKVIIASDHEHKENNRSRSAKLRVAEKL